jgi:hypothetical protein
MAQRIEPAFGSVPIDNGRVLQDDNESAHVSMK